MPNCKTCRVKISKGPYCGKCAKAAASSNGTTANLRANRGTADTSVGSDGRGTVRLQIQLNGKPSEKDKKNFEESEIIESTGGVTEDAIDVAFERMVTRWSAGKGLKAKARESYEVHKASWRSYAVGGSHSVNFDANSVSTGGRPQSGYRLDVENIRQGSSPNFI